MFIYLTTPIAPVDNKEHHPLNRVLPEVRKYFSISL